MKTKILLLVMAALALGACAKKNTSKTTTRAIRNGGTLAQGAGTTSCTSNTWGIIYDNTITDYAFRERLVRFTNNSDIGLVNPQPANGQTGVDIQMTVRFTNNQFDTAGSRLVMRIVDDKAYSQGMLADISMTAQSGSVIGGGSFTAVFRDDIGTVTLQGQKNYQNYVEGTISFTNTSGASEILGRFWIAGCALVGI